MRLGVHHLLTGIAAAGLCGCGSVDPGFSRIINEPMPVPAQVRASFGVMALMPASTEAVFEPKSLANPAEARAAIAAKTFNYLDRGRRESDKDAGAGGFDSHSSSSSSLGEQASAVMFESLVAGVAGVFGSLFAGLPEGEVRRGEAAFSGALQANPLAPGTRNSLARTAMEKHFPGLVLPPESTLASLRMQSRANPDYTAMAAAGIDSVLWLAVTGQQFEASGNLNPPLAVAARLELWVVRVADGQLLHSSRLEYRGEKRAFMNWSANDAKLFRDELERVQATFAAVMFDELFGGAPPQ